jgi:hypothetical protein
MISKLAATILTLCAFAVGALAQVPSGTEIKLILLKELNSGGSVIDEEVPFMVAEDVIVRG